MKATPGTLQEGGASFATTHWSVVAQSALTDVPEAANALAQLCEMYWPPIYSFIRRRGYSPADAQDLTQSFFAFFLRTKAYARTDPLHGKFRSFLLASVKNFLSDNWDRDQAIRRGGGYQFVSLDQETAEAFYDASKRVRFNSGTFIRITLGEIAHVRRAPFFAARLRCRRPRPSFSSDLRTCSQQQRHSIVQMRASSAHRIFRERRVEERTSMGPTAL